MHTIINTLPTHRRLEPVAAASLDAYRQPRYDCQELADAMKLVVYVPGVDSSGVEIEGHGADLTVDRPDQGMHLVAFTRRGLSDTAIERAGHQHGVVIRPMSRLYLAAAPRSALVLGFSGHARQAIAPAVERLARAVETQSRSPPRAGVRLATPKR